MISRSTLLHLLRQTGIQGVAPPSASDGASLDASLSDLAAGDGSDAALLDRVFTFIDSNGDGIISFRQFAVFIAPLAVRTNYDRLHFALEMYDVQNLQSFLAEETRFVLETLDAAATVFGDVPAPEGLVDAIVRDVFTSGTAARSPGVVGASDFPLASTDTDPHGGASSSHSHQGAAPELLRAPLLTERILANPHFVGHIRAAAAAASARGQRALGSDPTEPASVAAGGPGVVAAALLASPAGMGVGTHPSMMAIGRPGEAALSATTMPTPVPMSMGGWMASPQPQPYPMTFAV